MGLCKCPKKRVTNLFCFVHKVNVCEDCMITQHSRCVVRSYLQWLQDSDYEPVCLLCNQALSNGDVVRLCCLDLFHVTCLDKYIQTSQYGSSLTNLKCPCCKDTFFPPANMASPVAEKLRETIKSFWWGREGLGLAPEQYYDEDETNHEEEIMTESINNISHGLQPDIQLTSTPLVSKTVSVGRLESHDNHVNLQLHDQQLIRSIGHPTSHVDNTDSSLVHHYHGHTSELPHRYVPVKDAEDDKYMKKSPLEAVGRWYRNHNAWSTPIDDPSGNMKRYLLLAFLVFFFFVTLIVLMTRVGPRSADRNTDLDLDWRLNPHVKIGQ